MSRFKIFIYGLLVAAVPSIAAPVALARSVGKARQQPPGAPLSRVDTTPFAPSKLITGARWSTGRYDPPANQWGDILTTVKGEDGATYVLMDDGGVDVPVQGGLWRQSFARITGTPPDLRFQHIGDPSAPAPRTWGQIGNNPDNDDGPLGPYYSIGFLDADGIFYATLQRNWNWGANGPFTGLVGMAYSRDHGETWRVVRNSFPAPLGNLTFVDGGRRGGANPDGYVYAIGTEREFNASRLLLGRVRPGIENVTNPARWQWFGGSQTRHGKYAPLWTSSVASARPVLGWNSHIAYPQMTYDAPLHRYLLTFTYSYSSQVPAVWTGGAELVILDSPSPTGPFSFVTHSRDFGPSNGYGAGFPSQWISRNGEDLWLKWAANFDGCAMGLDCSGKYGFNLARVRLTVAPHPKATVLERVRTGVAYALSASALLLMAFAMRRRQLGPSAVDRPLSRPVSPVPAGSPPGHPAHRPERSSGRSRGCSCSP